jgi:ComEC/Rec2-related protein
VPLWLSAFKEFDIRNQPAASFSTQDTAPSASRSLKKQWQRRLRVRATRPLLVRWERLVLPALLAFCVAHGWVAYQVQTLSLPWLMGITVLLIVLAVRLVMQARFVWARRGLILAIALLGLVMGLLHASFRQSLHPPLFSSSSGTPSIQATLTGIARPFAKGWTLTTDATPKFSNTTGLVAGGHTILIRDKRPGALIPPIGATVQITGTLSPPRPALFEGAFSEEAYLRGLGLDGTLFRVQTITVLNAARPTWGNRGWQFMARIRHRVQGSLLSALGPEHGPLVGGLVLGEQAVAMPLDWKQRFRQTGLIHVLAASGMNVGIVAGATALVLVFCRVPPPVTVPVVMAVVAFYCALTGLPPSIQRAGAMIELALLLKLFNRRLSGLMLLGLALAGLLVWQPMALASLGLQLSVLTTLGLVGYGSALMRFAAPYCPRWLTATITVPLIAQAWASPLLVYHFNQLPLHSVALNLVAAPLVGIMSVAGFSGVCLAMVWPPAGQWVFTVCGPLAAGLLAVVRWGAAQSWASWQPASPPLWTVVWFYFALLMPVIGWHPRWQWPGPWVWRSTAVCLMVASLPGVWQWGQEIREPHVATLHHLPVSDHKAVQFLQAERRQTPWLVTPGRLSRWEGEQVVRYCAHQGWRQLPGLLVVGPSADSEGIRAIQTAMSISHIAIANSESASPSVEPQPTVAISRLNRTDRLLLPGGNWAQYTVDGERRPNAKSLGMVVDWQGARWIWGRYDRLLPVPAQGTVTWADTWAGRPWVVWQPNPSVMPDWSPVGKATQFQWVKGTPMTTREIRQP